MNPNSEFDSHDKPTPILDQEDAGTILELYQEYSYATPYHVLFTLMWRTGLRIDEVHTLDLDDYHPDEQYIEIHHRPDTGTGLADGRAAERHVALAAETCDLIEDYRGNHRHDVTDEYDREPLLTTEDGRPTRSLLEVTIHSPTRPWIYKRHCPHDRNPSECEATRGVVTARKCPSSFGPVWLAGVRPPVGSLRASLKRW